ncbi:MAG: tRNA (N6-threonylcarbamoyladenosine(37)-N6)-methyltransferase TrmO [Methanobacteriota archaeon]
MIELIPIGVISSPFKNRESAPRQGRECDDCCKITLYPQYREGLGEMIGISHIWVLYWMDRAERDILFARRPEWKEARPVFTIRSPARPNPIALSIGKILSKEEGVITVTGIEALDGSLVIDIKPYIPGLDSIPDAQYSALTHHNETKTRD